MKKLLFGILFASMAFGTNGALAGSCAKFASAIAWNKQTSQWNWFPVTVYFAKHFGGGQNPASPDYGDSVQYASGNAAAATGFLGTSLKGTLKVSVNTGKDGEMVPRPDLTVDVVIFPEGLLSYLFNINGKPIGGMPATVVQASCVKDVLLTAVTGSEVVTVGVARQPSQPIFH